MEFVLFLPIQDCLIEAINVCSRENQLEENGTVESFFQAHLSFYCYSITVSHFTFSVGFDRYYGITKFRRLK